VNAVNVGRIGSKVLGKTGPGQERRVLTVRNGPVHCITCCGHFSSA
jgi:hypothetical protein